MFVFQGSDWIGEDVVSKPHGVVTMRTLQRILAESFDE
jgi:hypothetical protein